LRDEIVRRETDDTALRSHTTINVTRSYRSMYEPRHRVAIFMA
jgi:hypothetical protein